MRSATEDPRVVRSRLLILDAAREQFLAHGYDGTTLEQVAEAAGVAKRTIYNLYPDKEALFRSTILSAIVTADTFSASLIADLHAIPDPLEQLPTIAERLALATLIGPVVPLRRLLIIESDRFPDLAREYRRRAPDAVMAALAGVFAGLVDGGHLRPCDPQTAAEHFAFLVMGADLDRGMFSRRRVTAPRVRQAARDGAEVFLRAYSLSG